MRSGELRLAIVDSVNLDRANKFTNTEERASFYDGLMEDGLNIVKEQGIQVIDKEIPALKIYGEPDRMNAALHALSRHIWQTGDKIWFVMHPSNSQRTVIFTEKERPKIGQ